MKRHEKKTDKKSAESFQKGLLREFVYITRDVESGGVHINQSKPLRETCGNSFRFFM